MQDEIIAEVWSNRDRLAEKHGYDLDDIVAAMRQREEHPLTAICEKPKRSLRESANQSR